ncbi:MAG: hypothetical protein WD851_23520 [Pirellulales bacterium]
MRTTSENGSYFDLPLSLGIGVRIQTGEYTIEERTYLTERTDEHSDEFDTPYGTKINGLLVLREETSRTTTTGSYGPGGLTESRDFSSTLSDRFYREFSDREPSGFWEDEIERYALTFNNDNGEISGHEYHRWQITDATGTYEILDPIVDRDLFENPPPTGPKGQATQGGYTPGILEATIFEAAVANLFPGGRQLNALANLLSPIAAAIAAIGQLKAEPTPPGYEGKYGLDADGDGYTDNWFKRQWQKLVHGPYQRFNLESPHLQPGDGQLRTGQTGLEGYRNATGQSAELLDNTAKNAALEATTGGLGGIWGKADDFNDLRKANKARQAGKFAQPILVAAKLTKEVSNKLRDKARSIWEGVAGYRAIDRGLRIHHRIPLEWSHIYPHANPNRLANLVGVEPGTHTLINNAWAAWKRGLNGRTPTQAEVMAQALKIDEMFGHLFTFPK